ncbi:hypothetical protein BDF14DRAFT_1756947 [Spinellus fusiger]|nr:hypothetical protein BDF14DRAFT_1756947 [Spinellus fusiger]
MAESEQQDSLIRNLEAKINTLLEDPLLEDIHSNVTFERLDTLIAIEKGHAYHVQVDRTPLDPINIIVRQSSTVQQVKKLIQRTIARTEPKTQRISWNYIWRSYCLLFEGQRLIDEHAVMSQLGIKENSILKFSRLGHEKGQHRKAWHWYRP